MENWTQLGSGKEGRLVFFGRSQERREKLQERQRYAEMAMEHIANAPAVAAERLRTGTREGQWGGGVAVCARSFESALFHHFG